MLGILKGDLDASWTGASPPTGRPWSSAFENWWDKYRVTLRDIEEERDAAKGRLDGFLEELGYAG